VAPAERLHDIADARLEIQDLLDGRDDGDAEVVVRDRSVRRPRHALAFVAVLLPASIVLTTLVTWRLHPKSAAPTPIRLEAALSPGSPLIGQTVLSPDGKWLSYGTLELESLSSRLHVRSLSPGVGNTVEEIDAYSPFFSSDSRWLAFVQDKELRKVAVSGGTPITVCEVESSIGGGTWAPDGTIVFNNRGLMRVPAAGGSVEAVTEPEGENETHAYPQFLPGGRHVLFTVLTRKDGVNGRIEIVDLDGGKRQIVYEGASHARFATSGHLFLAKSGALLAAPFDVTRLELTDEPARILPEVPVNRIGRPYYSLSTGGTLVYWSGDEPRERLMWVDTAGRMGSASQTPGEYHWPRLSPDGKYLAVMEWIQGDHHIWVLDLERDVRTRLTVTGNSTYPAWSPDGQFIYFAGREDDRTVVVRKRSDGSGRAEQVSANSTEVLPMDVSPDGKHLVVEDYATGRERVAVVSLEGEASLEPLVEGPGGQGSPAFSPDGRWVAYDSDESGQWEIYVRPFLGREGRWQVSREGGVRPKWSKDGNRLFYRSGNTIIAASFQVLGDSLELGRPETVVELEGHYRLVDFDVSPDGERFLVVAPEQSAAASTRVTFVFHWFEELKRQLL
jgi:serine/threonine-protein kinase